MSQNVLKIPEELPALFGRYRLVKLLGKGGMGSVYLALDPQLDRSVALKIPQLDAAAGAQVQARFYTEARAAAALQHPNICPVHDVGEVDGLPYLTMAYIVGKPLGEFAQLRPLLPRQSAMLVRKLALALAEAHKRGIIHRDLKPANIMVDKRGEPVIMDFGLARRVSKAEVRVTQEGSSLGTPAYMPPEQVRGEIEAMGPASDIYSLGVIMYELLAGRLPFTGDVMAMLCHVVLDEPPPPTQFHPDLDPELEAICLKAMAKKIEDRYTSMDELAAALLDHLRNKSGAAETTSAPPRAPATSSNPTPKPSIASRETTRGITASMMGGMRSVAQLHAQIPASRSAESPRPKRRQRQKRGRGVRWWVRGGTGGVVVSLLIGWVIYRATDYGTIRIDVVPATAQVEMLVDGKAQARDGLRLSRGPHQLIVTGGDYELESQSFTVRRGVNADLQVTLRPKVVATVAQADSKPVSKLEPAPGESSPLNPPVVKTQTEPAAQSAAPVDDDDVKRLQGTWSVTWVEIGERKMPVGGRNWPVKIEGNKWTDSKAIPLSGEATFQLDPSRTPKEITLTLSNGKQMLGIYEFGEGKLRWCTAVAGAVRPMEFKSAKDRPVRVFILVKRDAAGVDTQSGLARVGPQPEMPKPPSVGGPRATTAVGEIRRFQHPAGVSSAVFSPNGRRALTSCHDGVLYLWNLEDGRQLRQFRGHTDAAWIVAWSRNGRRAISAGADKTILLWNVITGEVIRRFSGHTAGIRRVAFSSDGKQIMSAGDDGEVRIWETTTGKLVRRFPGFQRGWCCAAWSPDDSRLLAASPNNLLCLWTIGPGNARFLKGHSAQIADVTFSPDGRRALSGSLDGTARYWNTQNGRQLQMLSGHGGMIHDVDISPEGRRALSSGNDGTLRLWDLTSGRELHRITGHALAVMHGVFSPDGHQALSSSADGTARHWSLPE